MVVCGLDFYFDFDRTLESVCFLLKQRPEQAMDAMVLLKLLYLADRKYLCAYGETLTGDTPYASETGPILSRVYGLIKKEKNIDIVPEEYVTRWQKHITAPKQDSVQLKQDPGTLNLCPAAIDVLTEIYSSFGDGAVDIDSVLYGLKEWRCAVEKIGPSRQRVPIDWIDVLENDPRMILTAQENIKMRTTSRMLLEMVCR